MKKFLLVLLSFCMLVSCGSGSGSKKDSVSFNLEVEPTSLDPQRLTDEAALNITQMLYEGLVRLNEKEELIPAGAESWETSEDGLTWTFHLRKTKWPEGEPVVAQNHVDPFMRILNPDNGFAYAFLAYDIEGAEEYNTAGGSADAVGVKAVDDYTLEIKLKTVVPYIISKISYDGIK